jgi:hypothetical protein
MLLDFKTLQIIYYMFQELRANLGEKFNINEKIRDVVDDIKSKEHEIEISLC